MALLSVVVPQHIWGSAHVPAVNRHESSSEPDFAKFQGEERGYLSPRQNGRKQPCYSSALRLAMSQITL